MIDPPGFYIMLLRFVGPCTTGDLENFVFCF